MKIAQTVHVSVCVHPLMGVLKQSLSPFIVLFPVHHETAALQQPNICSVSDVPSEVFSESNPRQNGGLWVDFEGVRWD